MQFSFSRSLRSLVKLFKWRYIINIFFFHFKGNKKENAILLFSVASLPREAIQVALYYQYIFFHFKGN